MKKLICFSLLFFYANQASAGLTATGNAAARVVSALAVSSANSLEFGSFTVSSSSGTINQAGTASGGVTAASSGATRQAGTFSVVGEPSVAYTYTVSGSASNQVTLSDGASHTMVATLTPTSTSTSSSSGGTLTGGGTDTITVNGSLAVAGNQTAGAYTGTYTVTVAY